MWDLLNNDIMTKQLLINRRNKSMNVSISRSLTIYDELTENYYNLLRMLKFNVTIVFIQLIYHYLFLLITNIFFLKTPFYVGAHTSS